MYNKKYKQGFTLVELSIVLVIIGLIVASVTAEKSLIRSAQIRALITQISTIETGVNSFIDRYNAIPGDFNNAVALFNNATLCPPATCNGNGNGFIDWTNGGDNRNTEVYNFFTHLSLAGLLDGQYNGTNLPYVKWRGYYMTPIYLSANTIFSASRAGNVIQIGSVVSPLYIAGTGASNYTAQDVYEFDVKIDDGVANTGIVYGVSSVSNGSSATSNITNGVGCAGYATAGSNYALQAQTLTCYIIYWMRSI